MDFIINNVYNIPSYGPMRVIKILVGGVQLESPDGYNFWLRQDRFAHGPLTKDEVESWAKTFEDAGFIYKNQQGNCRIRQWAKQIPN